MAGGTSYSFDFSKGSGLWCQPHYCNGNGYHNPTSDIHYFGEDPNYPDIVEAEAVKVVYGAGPGGENVLETDSSGGEDPAGAGIHISHQYMSLNRFDITCVFRFTAETLVDMPYAPLFYLSNNFTFDSELLLALYISGGNIVFELNCTGISRVDSYSIPVASASTTEWQTVRVIGRNGTYDSSTSTRDRDGYLKLFLNSQPIYDVENDSVNVGSGDVDAIITDVAFGFYGMVGQIAYLQISDSDGTEEKPESECCTTSRAAGGGITSPGGAVTPVGPRTETTVPVGDSGGGGGTTGSFGYVAVAGGGVLANATDPTDPQDPPTSAPVVSVELVTADSSTHRWGTRDIEAGTTRPPIERRVANYSRLPYYTLSDRHGTVPSPGFSIKVHDEDYSVKSWYGGANRFILNRYAKVLMDEYGQRQLDTLSRAITAGYVSGVEHTQDLMADMRFADLFGSARSPLSFVRQIPKRLFLENFFTKAPPEVYKRPVPIVCGEMSDDYDWSLDHTRLPVGICPAIYVGRSRDITFVNNTGGISLKSADWGCFVLAGHALTKISSGFMWSGQQDRSVSPPNDIITRGRFNPTYLQQCTDLLTQEHLHWSDYFPDKFVRIQGRDGSIEDYAMAFLIGAGGSGRLDYAVSGEIPLTWNGGGAEDVGDGTGNMFKDVAHQIAWFVCYWVIGDYRYGNYGPIPAYPDLTPKFNRTSVNTVNSIHYSRRSEGYPGAFMIGKDSSDIRTASDHLKPLLIGADIRLGLNPFGAVYMTSLDFAPSLSSLTIISDEDIRRTPDGLTTFIANPDPDYFENAISFDYGPEPATGRISGVVDRLVDSISYVNNGEIRENPPYTNFVTRYKSMAKDVAGRQLLVGSNAPITGQFDTQLYDKGMRLMGGQLIKLTSRFGLGSTGWTERVVQITNTWASGNDSEHFMTIEFEDVHDILNLSSYGSSVVGTDGLMFWAKPIGSSSLGTSQEIGSSALGTSRYLG